MKEINIDSMEDQKREIWKGIQMKDLRRRSGNVKSKDKLVAFLYQLMRDHLPTADVETLVLDNTGPNMDEFLFTNGYLAKYAINLAKRLREPQ